MRTKQNDMKNATPFTDSMIAKYEEQVAVLSPNEFGKYPYTKQALEVALSQLEMWQATKRNEVIAPLTATSTCIPPASLTHLWTVKR